MVFDEFINPDSEVKALKKNNAQLKEKFEQFIERYQKLDQQVNSLSDKSHDLRLKANLEPIKKEDQTFGTGGAIFESVKTASVGNVNDIINNIDVFVNKISLKVQLEKNNYDEIEKSLKENEKLFDALPALKPCSGTLANDFGMRFHPILRMMRMHNGVDIITDVGTDVFAPGAGTVDFVGRRSGYGLTIEVDHGFGYKTIYAHLHSSKVKQGQHINRGDLIAQSGNSGELSTGPHLHYEVLHDGIALDPKNFIYDDVSIFEIVKKQ